VVDHAGVEIARYALSPGEYTIGRASSSSILVQGWARFPQHARLLVATSGEVEIEDLGSANGTSLPSERIVGWTAWLEGETLRVGQANLVAPVPRDG
jgi:hypothetical protein